MPKKKFCSACGTDLVATGGNPDCASCAPKGPAKPYAVRTHTKSRTRYAGAYIRNVNDWTAAKIERETATLVFPNPAPSYYENSWHKDEVPLRFTTREEAQAFVDAAKASAKPLTEAYEAARQAEAAAREATREAANAVSAAGHAFFDTYKGTK